MTASHWYVLFVYFVFTLIATLLALAKRWIKPKSNGGNLWRKYPTYILINLLFLAAGWSPTSWHALTILLALLGALASWELSRALIRSPQILLFPVTTFLLILSGNFLDVMGWFKIWLATLLLAIAVATLTGKPDNYSRRALMLVGCVIYFPLCLAAYIWIQLSEPSGFHSVFLYLVVATNDALAQITGELFGSRSLVPHISPSKTIEGAIGGILFAGAMGFALSNSVGWGYITGIILGLALGLFALCGDLTASAWKRALGLKNFSGLLGAQGGILDRFDGLIFAAPVFYLLLVR